MKMSQTRNLAKTFLHMWESPWGAALLAFTIYLSIAIGQGGKWWETQNNYYNYLAEAFLHGQLHLLTLPTSTHDLVFYQDQYYLYWPPFPAALLMPFVMLFGTQFSGVFFTILIGGINVGLVSLLLYQLRKSEIAPLDSTQHSLLVIFFALGTVQISLAPFGNIWATGQLVAFLLVCLAYLSAISLNGQLAFFCTGLALACAMLTRNHTLFTGIWPLYFLIYKNWNGNWRSLLLNLGTAGLPILLAGLLYLSYNFARFGNPLDIGLAHHLMHPFFQSDYSKYGPFHTHYIPINFYYQYLYYPFPWKAESYMGGSLFLLSPVFFSIFWGIWKGAPRLSILSLALSIAITNIPILMLMGTGWVQIGPRYTLDFTVPLIILAALGISYWKTSILIVLTSISCLQYFYSIRYTLH